MRLNKLFLQLSFSLLLVAEVLTAATTPASAHTLKTDGSIGAILHLDPDDDPIVGQNAYFLFEFKDTSGKFDLKNCTCTININENERLLDTETLSSEASLDNASFSYIFPEKGVYSVELVGTANDSSFHNFKLIYDIRVDRTSASTTSGNNDFLSKNLPLLALGAVIIFLAVLTILNQRKTKDTKLKGTKISCLILGIVFLLLLQYGQWQQFLPAPNHHHEVSSTTHSTSEHLPCCGHPAANVALIISTNFNRSNFSEILNLPEERLLTKALDLADSRSPPII